MSSEALKCRKELKKLMKDPQNKHCADCGMYPATWTSCNLGVFICVGCSGIHRSLGVHISFVKSATLDDWNIKLLEKFKEQGGNDTVNAKYEASLPSNQKINPTFHDTGRTVDIVKFIRSKYEKKLWYKNIKPHNKHNHKKHKHHKNHKTSETIKSKHISQPKPRAKSPTLTANNNETKQPIMQKKHSILSFNELDMFYEQTHNSQNDLLKQKSNENTDDILAIMNSDTTNNTNQWVGFDDNTANNTANNNGFDNNNSFNESKSPEPKSKDRILAMYHANNANNYDMNFGNMNMANVNVNNKINTVNVMNNMNNMAGYNGYNGYNNQFQQQQQQQQMQQAMGYNNYNYNNANTMMNMNAPNYYNSNVMMINNR